jgi:hypothetical protein
VPRGKAKPVAASRATTVSAAVLPTTTVPPTMIGWWTKTYVIRAELGQAGLGARLRCTQRSSSRAGRGSGE